MCILLFIYNFKSEQGVILPLWGLTKSRFEYATPTLPPILFIGCASDSSSRMETSSATEAKWNKQTWDNVSIFTASPVVSTVGLTDKNERKGEIEVYVAWIWDPYHATKFVTCTSLMHTFCVYVWMFHHRYTQIVLSRSGQTMMSYQYTQYENTTILHW